MEPLPKPGQIVKVRERQYLVEHVAPFEEGACTPVALACLADDAQGERLEVLWEAELDRQILEVSWDALARPDRGVARRDAHGAPRPFDPPRHFAAYLSALRLEPRLRDRPDARAGALAVHPRAHPGPPRLDRGRARVRLRREQHP